VNNNRLLLGVGLLFVGGWLLYLLAPILTPFVAAFLLAYLGNPVVNRLERWQMPRVLAVTAVFIGIASVLLGLLLILIPQLARQVSGFATNAPAYLEWAQQHVIPKLNAWFGGALPLNADAMRDLLITRWQELGDWLSRFLAHAAQSGARFLAMIVNVAVTAVVTFYLLLDWERVLTGMERLLPSGLRPRARRLARETDEVLGSFLRGQLLVMLVLALIYISGLWWLGLDLALPLGLVAGLVSFVPYLGFILGVLSASLAAYLQFQDILMVLGVLGVFLTGQVLESLWLSPRLVGERIGLHPVAVIFSVLAGGQMFGFFGTLLALPAAAVLKVWLTHVTARHPDHPSGSRQKRKRVAKKTGRRA
jgi:predicted PurR-regulated permease PerM